jgi:hypothetical protein
LGPHSERKGSGSYAASGSTACPSTTAIHLRALVSPAASSTVRRVVASES